MQPKANPWRTPNREQREIGKAGVEASCVRWAQRRGWWTAKFKSPGKRSAPDRTFAKESRVVWVEFKRRGKKPTKKQLDYHAEMRKAGLDVRVFDNKADFVSAFTALEQELSGWLN